MMPTHDTTVVASRLPNHLVTQMDNACLHSRLTRSVYIRKMLSWYLQFGPKRTL